MALAGKKVSLVFDGWATLDLGNSLEPGFEIPAGPQSSPYAIGMVQMAGELFVMLTELEFSRQNALLGCEGRKPKGRKCSVCHILPEPWPAQLTVRFLRTSFSGSDVQKEFQYLA